MTTQQRNWMTLMVVFALLMLSLTGTPAAADQDSGQEVTPLVTIFAPGALLNYDRAAQHYQLYLGKNVVIDDAGRDESAAGSAGAYYEKVDYSSGGIALLLILLVIQVVIAARGSLAFHALSPRNDGDYKN